MLLPLGQSKTHIKRYGVFGLPLPKLLDRPPQRSENVLSYGFPAKGANAGKGRNGDRQFALNHRQCIPVLVAGALREETRDEFTAGDQMATNRNFYRHA